MEKKIIFLDNLEFVKANIKKVKDLSLRLEAPLVPLSDSVLLFVKSCGLSYVDFHDFEKGENYEDLYKTAVKWGTNWYSPKGPDFTLRDSYSLGNVLDWSMIYYFSGLLRLYLVVKMILENIKPDHIVFLVPAGEEGRLDCANLDSLDLCSVEGILKICIQEAGWFTKYEIIKIKGKLIFKLDVKYYFKLFILLCLSPFLLLFNFYLVRLSKSPRIIFFEGFSHFRRVLESKALGGIQLIHLQKVFGPALFLKLLSRGVSIDSLLINRSTRKLNIFPDLKKNLQELNGFFLFRNADLSEAVLPRLRYLLSKYLFVIYSDICTADKILKRLRPDCIVVENSCTYYEKILVIVAKSKKIPSVVVQDGASCIGDSYKNECLAIHNFYPLLADRIFCFGEVNRNWFLNKKISPESIVVTGGSRFDVYYKSSLQNLHKDERTILVVLSDIWEQGVVTDHIQLTVIYRHIKGFVDLAKKNKKINFLIRPHDQDGLWKQLFLKELNQLDNLVISREGDLVEILQNVDLVVGYNSTVLIEALISRIPVISLDTGDFYNSVPLWNYGLAKRVVSFEDLHIQVNKILFSGGDRANFMDAIEKNISLFNYKDDGKASDRIAEQLRNMVIVN
jgi:UDP-N-acetylglucosamine 2-epimerase